MKRITRRAFLKDSGVVTAGLALPWLINWQAALRGVAQDSTSELFPAAPTAPTAYQLQTPHQALEMDVSASTWDTRFTQLANQGYRPIWVQGSTNGTGAATYSGIWVRDGVGPWYEFRDMDAATYQTNFTNYGNAGYRPISVSGYQNSGANRFVAVWLYAPGVGYSGIHNATSAQYQTFVNNAVSAGLWPQVVDGYAVGTDPTASDDYISIWADLPVTAAEARHGLTSAQYQSFFNTYAPQGYRVTCVSAYQINGTTYFAAFMVKDGITDWSASHDWLPGDLFNHAIDLEHQDYQPIVIEGYDTGATRNFAAVWIKKARTWTTTGSYNANLASFDSAMQTFMQTRNIPGGSLAVTKDSRLVYARGYRWDGYIVDAVQPDSLFRIASLTKPLTSMAVMRLVQEGTLHLSDHLTSLLSLPAPLDARMNNITVLNLLQHMGGWNRDTTGFDPMFADQTIAAAQGVALPISRQDIINYMTTKRNLDFAPGTQQDYSNYGYLLLGRIIAAVTGIAYGTYMQTHVFGPLGISRITLGRSEFENRASGEVTYFTTDPGLYANMRQAGAPNNVMAPYGNFNIENMDSHGGYLASAIDLACFATAFDATGLYPILTQATIDQIFAVPSVGISPDGSWYGCGWAVRTAGTGLNTWHNGSLTGTSTLMVRRFDGLDWVVLFNQRDDPNDPTGATYGDIDGALHVAADAVTKWPTGDLFPNYGLPSRYLRHAFLPLIQR
ncbi:MAG TPA: serine hydrolase [Anaerolineae bacterium]|nr:serine hydrolase [Anaerolineae bacterium]